MWKKYPVWRPGVPFLYLFGGLCFCIAAFGQATPPASSAPAAQGSVNDILKGAFESFNNGDFQTAATALETVLQEATDSPALEPVYYMLGSAYFNLANYPKAIEVFKKYEKKFPTAPRLVTVSFSLGQAYLLTKQYPEAAAEFKALEKISPHFREESLLYAADALKDQGKTDEEIAALEQLVGPEIKTQIAAKAALMLAPLYAEKDDDQNNQKAVALVNELARKMNLIENIVQFNSIAIKLGDKLLDNRQYSEALTCYRAVPLKGEVIQLQTAHIEAMQDAVAHNTQAIQADPKIAPDLAPVNSRLKADIEQAKPLLADFVKVPDYAPTLYLRMGRALYELGQKWESVVAFGEVLRKYPNSVEAEPSLFSVILSFVDLQRTKQAQNYCAQYLRDFPTGPNAQTVGYLMGAVTMDAGDFAGAEAIFKKMLASQPNSSYRMEMLFMLGNCKFAQSNYDDASTVFKQYLSESPTGTHAEDAAYHIAVAILFDGKPDDAIGPLQEFLQKYPAGTYAADAKYRVGVCESARQDYDAVFALCTAWQNDYRDNPELAEVLSLQGDAYAATGKVDDAIASYQRASKIATNPDTLKYALIDGACKQLQRKGDWEQEAAMLEEFVKKNPDSPLAITAYFEIGRALVRQHKVEEAKTFLAQTLKKYMGDPRRDDVEKILTQLVQICVKKSEPAADIAGASPAAVAAPSPNPNAELDSLLGGPGGGTNATARARLLFAKALLAGLQKRPGEEALDFQAIANQFKPADLSAVVLAQTADYLVQTGHLDKAGAYYAELEKTFPKSEQIDSAWVGLGEIAYQKRDYATALRQFSQAVDKSTSAAKLKDATLGKANTLMALNQLDEARKLFEQVASVREWRGPATAESVFSLGQIAAKQGKLPQAIAYYQRVYVAYQRYLPWVAKAYIASGEIFEKMGKVPEAVNTYNEMLRNDKLSTFPEADEARQRLQALPPLPPGKG